MKNKKNFWRKYGGFVFGSIIILGIVGLYYINSGEDFKITKEECWNETLPKSNWHILEAGEFISNFDSHDFIYLEQNEIRPIGFRSREYVKEKVCFDLFKSEGIFPYDLGFSQSAGVEGVPYIMDNFYKESFFVEDVYCLGTIYEENYLGEEDYYLKKDLRKELEGLYVKIPPFNESKIELRERFDNEIYLINNNRYWDVEFRVVPNVTEEKCEQVEVEEDETQMFESLVEDVSKYVDENCENIPNLCGVPDLEDCNLKYQCGEYQVEVLR